MAGLAPQVFRSNPSPMPDSLTRPNRCALQIYVEMPQDLLSHLPLEILQEMLRSLDSLDFLRCRQVSLRLKCGIESLPEYLAYKSTHSRVLNLYCASTRKKGRWQAAGIRRFLDLMRVKTPPSDARMLMVLKCYLASETVRLVGFGS